MLERIDGTQRVGRRRPGQRRRAGIVRVLLQSLVRRDSARQRARDVERGRVLSAAEAVDYGLVDELVERKRA